MENRRCRVSPLDKEDILQEGVRAENDDGSKDDNTALSAALEKMISNLSD